MNKEHVADKAGEVRTASEKRTVKNTLRRRTFLKAAGAAAGFIIAEGQTAFSYAQNSKVRIGCIGVGAQGTHNIREGLTHTPESRVVAIAEAYKPNQDAAANVVCLSNAGQYVPEGQSPSAEQLTAAHATPAPSLSYDYREVLANPNVDAVIIATPPRAQFQIVMEALNAGKYVFCETPLVRSVEQGRYLVEKCHELGRWVQVGYQHRYNPKYHLAQSLVYERGMVGRITHISAQSHENTSERRPLPGGCVLNDEERKHISDLNRHLNWRLYSDQSRGLYTGAALHHLDGANWFLRSVPSRVFAAGGQDYWEDGRTNDDNMVIVCEYDLKTGSPGHIRIKPRTNLMNEATANLNYTVRFVHSSLLNSGTRGTCQLVQGDRGSLALGCTRCLYQQELWAMAEEYDQPLCEAYASGAIRPPARRNLKMSAHS
jgi:predicted dehydrogenase